MPLGAVQEYQQWCALAAAVDARTSVHVLVVVVRRNGRGRLNLLRSNMKPSLSTAKFCFD